MSIGNSESDEAYMWRTRRLVLLLSRKRSYVLTTAWNSALLFVFRVPANPECETEAKGDKDKLNTDRQMHPMNRRKVRGNVTGIMNEESNIM